MSDSPFPNPGIEDSDFANQFILEPPPDATPGTTESMRENYVQNQKLYYHAELLEQAGYITTYRHNPEVIPVTLTYAGHQYLAAINMPSAKERIREAVTKFGNTTTPDIVLSIVKAVGEAAVKSALGIS